MNRPLLATLFAALLLASACEQDSSENIYKPGGRYYTALDSRGTRHLVIDEKGEPLAKIRALDNALRIYDAQMRPVGSVEWDEKTVTATVRGGDEPTSFVRESDDVVKFGDSLRLERVENGWAVFGPSRLGYVERLDDGRLALRDDYSSAPRVYARKGEHEAKTPGGKVPVTSRPGFDSEVILPFALEGELDPLKRVALGVWFREQL